MKLFRKLLALAITTSLLSTLATPSIAATTHYDMEEITSHVNLSTPRTLSIGRPSAEGNTLSNNYFIAGSSNSNLPLNMNGNPVTTRGELGSFGVYVSLQNGVNVFRFDQGENAVQVSIRKGAATSASKINNLRQAAPSYDIATYSGETMTLSCVAPSGAKVVATIGGQTITLLQAAQAESGVPADFRAKLTAPTVTGAKDLGKVTYTMTYNGKTVSQPSAGSIIVAGADETLIVQVKNNAGCTYDADNMMYFQSVVKIGAVDYVTEIGSKCYRLSSGGWIPKETVTPLTGNISVKNRVSDTSFETSSRGETVRLVGTTHPIYTAKMENGSVSITFFNTSGVSSIDMEKSRLFSRAKIETEGTSTTINFSADATESLWGYDITYKNGVTSIYFKYAPQLSKGDKPLSGITVVVDAGHGGTDPGALGFAMTKGATEEEINLASAIAVQKRLQTLGADVVMTRTKDEDLSMNDRMTTTRKADADFFISLHSNAIGSDVNGNNVSGVEAYYYFDDSKKFAASAAANVAQTTKRQARGAKFSNFRVTLNTFCPSILLEMGFLTNPQDYDQMIGKQGIYRLANGVADSIVQTLSK